jgi:hypothetical protein
MRDIYADDLSDFIRNGKLDGYELTDEELAQFLEVWRWTVWTRYGTPSVPDHTIVDAVQHLQAHMEQRYGVEVDYNTLLLLREELEPLMYMRVLWDIKRVVLYFLRPRNMLLLLRTLSRARRYNRTQPLRDFRTHRFGYAKADMEQVHEQAPDLVRRKYWHRLGASLQEMRKRPDWW